MKFISAIITIILLKISKYTLKIFIAFIRLKYILLSISITRLTFHYILIIFPIQFIQTEMTIILWGQGLLVLKYWNTTACKNCFIDKTSFPKPIILTKNKRNRLNLHLIIQKQTIVFSKVLLLLLSNSRKFLIFYWSVLLVKL